MGNLAHELFLLKPPLADEKGLRQAYPKLTADNIHAALRYAADSLTHEEVVLSAAV